jgi:predicted kinase
MIKLKDILREIEIEEGVNDPNILKAVFLAGGPGSGKSTVAKHLFGIPTPGFTTGGLKNVNSDRFFEFMLKKQGLSTDLASMSPEEFERTTVGPESPRGRAKQTYKTAEALYLGGRLGMLIDGTGDNVKKIQAYADKLQNEFGYDTYMVFVNTPMEVALERNNNRERKLPRHIVEDSWKEAQKAKEFYKKMFGNRFIEVMNDKNTPKGQPLDIDPQASKAVDKFLAQPVNNPIGKKWIEDAKAATKLNEVEASDIKIYCDMDGVLADFVKQWKVYHRQDPIAHKKKIGKKEFDEFLDGAPLEFWVDMDFMPDARGGKALWDKIKKYNTEILSSPADSEASRKGKQLWLKSKGINIPLNLKKSYKKQEFAAPNHILIDDYKRNIDQWKAAGGIGIHHTTNAKTFAELKKYGIV